MARAISRLAVDERFQPRRPEGHGASTVAHARLAMGDDPDLARPAVRTLELNVRTYVRVGGRPGVYFFSLDAANPVAVGVARILVHLPYFTADMRCEEEDGLVHYRSDRTTTGAPSARLVARYRPTGPAQPPVAGTLEYFLTERYCLFTVDKALKAYTVDIHHPSWPLQAAEAEITVNTMADAAGIRLPPTPPLLHFARR
jgi:uncharacterized protein